MVDSLLPTLSHNIDLFSNVNICVVKTYIIYLCFDHIFINIDLKTKYITVILTHVKEYFTK